MGISSSTAVVVNTIPSKSVSWKIKSTVSEHRDKDFDLEFIEKLRGAVLRLPARVSLPRYVSLLSLPRYYLIVLDEDFNIIDIVGVRADMSPTKWSYRLGYWHPRCQLDIARALALLLKRQEFYQPQQQPTV
jgi:hypothetical protein